MKTTGDSIPRRAFLSGAASLLGASAMGVAPRLGPQPSGSGSSGLVAYFWNGTNFVPVGQAPSVPFSDRMAQVDLQELMGSSTPVAIDAVLPGGTFQAYVGSPRGSGRARFSAPLTAAGLALEISQGKVSQTFALGTNGALGFYLIVSEHQKVNSLMLVESGVATVIDTQGAPLGNPTILIQLM